MMRAEQISENIWCIKAWMLIPLRVWMVKDEDGVTLIDAGMPFMTKRIVSFIKQLNVGPLKRILLTHGHSDHVGAVKKIVETESVPVYAHRIEIPYMEGKKLYPRRKKLEVNVQPDLAQPLPEDEQGNLSLIGGLQPYLTPGHSPGHVVYYHEKDGVMLAGDLFTSKRGRLHRPMPMFTADMAQALKSSLIIRHLRPRHVEVCHGKPIHNPAEQLDDYLKEVSASFSIPASVWQS
ncbi:MBL fold metallo-hydrolase [Brevibacillus sp. 179-C9.3 HS]|uniref:MBL fold metallo-hydrolase n=1 Tax=unclassified Brevibacillus TaxID=2684853 RepID=UPI0039A3CF1D